MNVGQKVKGMKADLTEIVSICNLAGEYRLASIAQNCLQSVGNFSKNLGETPNEGISGSEFKARPGQP